MYIYIYTHNKIIIVVPSHSSWFLFHPGKMSPAHLGSVLGLVDAANCCGTRSHDGGTGHRGRDVMIYGYLEVQFQLHMDNIYIYYTYIYILYIYI